MAKYKSEEYIQMYNNYKSMLSHTVGQILSYKESWDDEFCRSEINKCYEALVSEFKDIEFTKFTEDELKQLDFKFWDEDLLLMPVWAIDFLKEGMEVHSINGQSIIINKGDKLSKDSRFGSTAYGFKKSQLRDVKLERILSE